uniref:SFRICE_030180 n=1 Tax=Spodoptera frugiperda TaxID=7108 RepID=A0A2H1V101_SPOFR
MSNNKWTKKITGWIPRDCKRSRGRQRKRWADIFLERQGPTWMTKARNRQYWKKTGEAYAEEATTT